VPEREINQAIRNLEKFKAKPEKHTYQQEG
jgi:hypothetical protein